MKEFLNLAPEKREAIFYQTAERKGLPPQVCEKDWWVVQTLKVIFSLEFREALVFKGGTSLSKSWNLIERFSEDIDLALDKRYLGFEGELTSTGIRKLRTKTCSII